MFDFFTFLQWQAQGVLHEGENEGGRGGGNGIPLREQRQGWPNKVGKHPFPDFAKLGPPGCRELAFQWFWGEYAFQ